MASPRYADRGLPWGGRSATIAGEDSDAALVAAATAASARRRAGAAPAQPRALDGQGRAGAPLRGRLACGPARRGPLRAVGPRGRRLLLRPGQPRGLRRRA